MKQQVLYKKDELLKLLPGFKVLEISVTFEDNEVFEGKYTGKSLKTYLTNRSDIKSINEYRHMFGTQIFVTFQNDDIVELYPNNISIRDKVVTLQMNNDFLSPSIICDGTYIPSSRELIEWLKNMNITVEQLDSISDFSTIYERIIYEGVPTPVISFGSFGYSCENLVLDEREIVTVLNSIKDKMLREKIKCILYARVFKRR